MSVSELLVTLLLLRHDVGDRAGGAAGAFADAQPDRDFEGTDIEHHQDGEEDREFDRADAVPVASERGRASLSAASAIPVAAHQYFSFSKAAVATIR